jgi:TrmH family RNA methyltransferase
MPLTKAEIARLRSLQDKKSREALGLFVVEGEKVVGELLSAGFPFTELYATEAWDSGAVGRVPSPGEANAALPENSGVRAPRPQVAARRGAESAPYQLISDAEMARISHYPTPSSVLAVGQLARRPLAPGALDRGLTLALDGIQDPGNVGTLLRIADWFALDRVVLAPDCADLFSQKVINASMGSFARVVAHTAPLADALAGCTAPVLGCDLHGDDVHALPALRDAVVVVGSEGRGLSAAVAARVTRRVTIPKFGGAESLNAAVAAAIVCDNLRRIAPR